jgi:hypothetical protein
VDLLGSDDSLFACFTGLLEIFMLHNVSTASTRGVSGKLLDLFFGFQNGYSEWFLSGLVPSSDHNVLFFSVRHERPRSIKVIRSVRSFRDIDIGELLSAATMLNWKSVQLVAGIDYKIDLFYSMLYCLMYTFEPKRVVKLRDGDVMSGIQN